jgi:tRNA splicing endonuclease
LTSLRAFASPEERRLRAVYRDLWERGLTIGSGSAYGADFTTYEGREGGREGGRGGDR